MGIPVSTYGAHERAQSPGGRDYGPEDAKKYARRFGVTPEWLLTGREPFPVGDEPPPPKVPMCKVANSRTTLSSPITRAVSSPAYLRSWGTAPTEANWKIRLRSPIAVSFSITTDNDALFAGLPDTAGNHHSLLFRHQFTKGGLHAYDFLTSFAQAQAEDVADLGVTIILNPCGPDIGPPSRG